MHLGPNRALSSESAQRFAAASERYISQLSKDFIIIRYHDGRPNGTNDPSLVPSYLLLTTHSWTGFKCDFNADRAWFDHRL
jgi:hypothetical protein